MPSTRCASLSGKIAFVIVVVILVSELSAQIRDKRPRIGIAEGGFYHSLKFSTPVLGKHPEIAAHESPAAIQIYRKAWKAVAGPRKPPVSFASANRPVSDPTVAPSRTGDFAVYALNTQGAAGGQANLVGLTGFYTGTPEFLSSFNTTGTPGGILASPVLSVAGKKVACVETIHQGSTAGYACVFHVLTMPTTTGANRTSATASGAPPADTLTARPASSSGA
jgi:hypothetical protein